MNCERIYGSHVQYPKKRCNKLDCQYHTEVSKDGSFIHGCNYMMITGHSRIAQLPEDQRDPAVCPLYEKGKRRHPSKKMIVGGAT